MTPLAHPIDIALWRGIEVAVQPPSKDRRYFMPLCCNECRPIRPSPVRITREVMQHVGDGNAMPVDVLGFGSCGGKCTRALRQNSLVTEHKVYYLQRGAMRWEANYS
jgi:hypothetical protein